MMSAASGASGSNAIGDGFSGNAGASLVDLASKSLPHSESDASYGKNGAKYNPLKKKLGFQGRTGPDFRVAPAEESAITRAIRTVANRKDEYIFLPVEGMTFNSREEARDFYNLYSWERGFGVRYGRDRKNDGMYRTRQDLVCSCEGFDRRSNSESIRTGCLARMRLLRTKDHGWYVSSFSDEHNHRFSDSFAENKQWPSHGLIDAGTKDFIRRMRENNVSLGRICNILGGCDQNVPSGLRRESVRSICSKFAQEELRDDIGKTLTLLDEMKYGDPLMQVRFQLDTKRRIKSMLWCTGKNISDYAKFSDAITFDTTYRTNLYSLPFGLFVGVNNHFQSVIFGGVLLTTEKTADFEWAFKSFVDIMGGLAPKTMLTDQCAAMAKALRNVLSSTRHRWCRWHVLKSAKERLGHVYAKYKKFKEDFYDLVTYETDRAVFERRWSLLLTKYRLRKNKYMMRLYKYRERWAKPYFMDVFCAGMTSTQRSESGNHMLKRYIQRAAPMHLFVRKLNELQVDRYEQTGKEEHFSNQVARKLRIGVPIEAHAKDIYTRAMYEMFCDELFESGGFAIDSALGNGSYLLVEINFDGNVEAKRFNVQFNGIDEIYCQCGFFAHVGMLCRHSLKVLVHLDVTQIPSKNILQRWMKSASVVDALGNAEGSSGSETSKMVRKLIVGRAYEIACKEGSMTDADLMKAFKALENIGASSSSIADDAPSLTSNLNNTVGDLPIHCPPRTLTGGRPPSTGLKAFMSRSKKRQKRDVGNDAILAGWPDEENPPAKKKTTMREIMRD